MTIDFLGIPAPLARSLLRDLRNFMSDILSGSRIHRALGCRALPLLGREAKPRHQIIELIQIGEVADQSPFRLAMPGSANLYSDAQLA